MAIRIRTPEHSFIQFAETDVIDSCQFDAFTLCLPVFSDNDIFFQFFLDTDTEAEADGLCDLTNSLLTIGITDNCSEDFLMEFPYKAERYRVGPKTVLYNWQHGLPNFGSVISTGECFLIKISLQQPYSIYDFCSNCFERIASVCHTSVVEYGNDDNAFGFSYCASADILLDNPVDCAPTPILFTNKATLSIPYTTELQLKYGAIPSVQVWIYDGTELVDMGIRVSFDAFPPTIISMDFGGISSGIVKLS